MDYIEAMFTDFTEVHGDRLYGDDAACVAGFAHFDGRPCAVLGQQKGRDVKENVFRNFGQMHPEGYRKAMRVMRLAEKFGRPIVIFIDTAGAFPGIGAEERGQAEAIARNIMEMSLLRVPVICTIIGEGGSGGALGIGVGDRVLMQHNAYYSVISPEGCASILWRDAKFAPQAAETLRITSSHLMELGIIDEIVPEPLGGAHRDPAAAIESLKAVIARNLAEVSAMGADEMLEARFQKFRCMGVFEEEKV
jgi:acetyl-CoA carboxylase carboxyl transferase subunit alpha